MEWKLEISGDSDHEIDHDVLIVHAGDDEDKYTVEIHKNGDLVGSIAFEGPNLLAFLHRLGYMLHSDLEENGFFSPDKDGDNDIGVG